MARTRRALRRRARRCSGDELVEVPHEVRTDAARRRCQDHGRPRLRPGNTLGGLSAHQCGYDPASDRMASVLRLCRAWNLSLPAGRPLAYRAACAGTSRIKAPGTHRQGCVPVRDLECSPSRTLPIGTELEGRSSNDAVVSSVRRVWTFADLLGCLTYGSRTRRPRVDPRRGDLAPLIRRRWRRDQLPRHGRRLLDGPARRSWAGRWRFRPRDEGRPPRRSARPDA